MKIVSLQISNVLSFRHFPNISEAEKITFDEGLNIIIGENGAGKSTALEVINFLFKRVLYKQYNVNQDLYFRKNSITADERRQILLPTNNQSYSGFRLDPNWDTEGEPQTIRIELRLDAIDAENLAHLLANRERLHRSVGSYSTRDLSAQTTHTDTYILDIILNKDNRTFSVNFYNGTSDLGYEYISEYNFYKESIAFYNLEHPEDAIAPLYESFTLISSYRNYHAFERAISLRDQHPNQQMQNIRSNDFNRSLNASDTSEPPIFALVRLRVAEKHFSLISQKLSEKECEEEANRLPFIVSINNRLKVVNLECRIRLIDLRTWQYSFEFHDLRRKKVLTDVNSLSAGQKAIIHLVFEAYGRGDLKGGVIIIDEPEIHLHYQFQNEYLQVIKELNREQNCQYILVTHSEALINSSTITQVRRFSLNASGFTEVKSPQLSTDQRMLIKILDNTRSTYAFFAKKVLLVEGDTDRYFFKSIIQEKYPQFDQEIAILDVSGKGAYAAWKDLFTNFGLTVCIVADLDYAIDLFYPGEKGQSLRTPAEVAGFKTRNTDWEGRINAEYPNKTFILKNGDLEHYLNISSKGLDATIAFCNTDLSTYLSNDSNSESLEIREIVRQVTL